MMIAFLAISKSPLFQPARLETREWLTTSNVRSDDDGRCAPPSSSHNFMPYRQIVRLVAVAIAVAWDHVLDGV